MREISYGTTSFSSSARIRAAMSVGRRVFGSTKTCVISPYAAAAVERIRSVYEKSACLPSLPAVAASSVDVRVMASAEKSAIAYRTELRPSLLGGDRQIYAASQPRLVPASESGRHWPYFVTLSPASRGAGNSRAAA